jgi:hypothetical protein
MTNLLHSETINIILLHILFKIVKDLAISFYVVLTSLVVIDTSKCRADGAMTISTIEDLCQVWLFSLFD